MKHFRDAAFVLLDAEIDRRAALNRGASGEEGFIVTLRDITRRHRAEQELESVNRKLASMAWQDGLTGLGNRRRFDQVLAQGWESCRLAGLPLSVIMADVDHFKRYNDHYGHQEGDHCLAGVANAIKSCLRREGDCAARYGGEEFGLILPGIATDAAGEIAERIRDSIEELALPHVGSPLGRITMSFGRRELRAHFGGAAGGSGQRRRSCAVLQQGEGPQSRDCRSWSRHRLSARITQK